MHIKLNGGMVRGSLGDQVLSERRLERRENLALSREGSTMCKGPEVSVVKKHWNASVTGVV